MMAMEVEYKKVKCDKCGHTWDTKSKHVYVTCPSCLAKVKIK